ncbi:hypothetical protein GALMADRAFT_268310 [Galerina marginata CBS 339.88]|uniref:Uncharacterized protein n=1 Tax=Galerina marginata (strain CBS 339.88) TaxID=685588 RepID=A0A067T9R2_GALM3|nr:hypothetical protein GALMADRAFT_268310 [Galerina marginata CBS 339.88]
MFSFTQESYPPERRRRIAEVIHTCDNLILHICSPAAASYCEHSSKPLHHPISKITSTDFLNTGSSGKSILNSGLILYAYSVFRLSSRTQVHSKRDNFCLAFVATATYISSISISPWGNGVQVFVSDPLKCAVPL